MYRCDSWTTKKAEHWCFRTVVLGMTLESSLDCKEVKPVNPKGNQSWIFFERTDAKAEVTILWPLDANSWLTGKDPDAGKNWGQEEKGATENEMVGWYHWRSGHEFEQTRGDSDREAWHAAVRGVTKNQAWLSDWTTTTSLGMINSRDWGKWHYFILFYGWIIFYWIYIPHLLYPPVNIWIASMSWLL